MQILSAVPTDYAKRVYGGNFVKGETI